MSSQPPAVAVSSGGLRPSPWIVAGFRPFIVSMVAVTVANQIQGTVVAYQIYELTRDPLSLGAVGLAEALPFLSLALVGGHVADGVIPSLIFGGSMTLLATGIAAFAAPELRRLGRLDHWSR